MSGVAVKVRNLTFTQSSVQFAEFAVSVCLAGHRPADRLLFFAWNLYKVHLGEYK